MALSAIAIAQAETVSTRPVDARPASARLCARRTTYAFSSRRNRTRCWAAGPIVQTAGSAARISVTKYTPLERVKPCEAAVERHNEQEREEHLDTGDYDSHLSRQLGEIATQALVHRLVATVLALVYRDHWCRSVWRAGNRPASASCSRWHAPAAPCSCAIDRRCRACAPPGRAGRAYARVDLGRPERSPPRRPEEMSWVEVRECVRDSPLRARSLLTVRAAISSARSSDAPWPSSLSLMCSY